MATSSFAVGSVSVAIVWGVFFYPPPPERSAAPPGASAPAEPAVQARPAAPADAALPLVSAPVVAAAAGSRFEANPSLGMVNAATLAAKQ